MGSFAWVGSPKYLYLAARLMELIPNGNNVGLLSLALENRLIFDKYLFDSILDRGNGDISVIDTPTGGNF
jgi:hypothetical protein